MIWCCLVIVPSSVRPIIQNGVPLTISSCMMIEKLYMSPAWEPIDMTTWSLIVVCLKCSGAVHSKSKRKKKYTSNYTWEVDWRKAKSKYRINSKFDCSFDSSTYWADRNRWLWAPSDCQRHNCVTSNCRGTWAASDASISCPNYHSV